jgi:RNA polymerase-binding transcription factor
MPRVIDLKSIHEALEKERGILQQDIQREKDKLGSYIEVNPDQLDLADQSRYQGISLNRLEHMENWLEQIEAALKRMRDGTYGICARCGNPINPERIEAMPAALYCLKCQEKQERRSY